MILRVYDQEMNFLGACEDFRSLTWTRKPQKVGSFSLVAANTEKNRALAAFGNMIWFKGATDAGIIEKIQIDTKDQALKISGRFLASLLNRRVVYGSSVWMYDEDALLGDGIEADEYLYTIYSLSRPFSFIETPAPTFSGIKITYYDLIAALGVKLKEGVIWSRDAFEDMTVLQAAQRIAAAFGFAFHVRQDFENNRMVFECYTGTNHGRGGSGSLTMFTDRDGEIEGVTRTETVLGSETACLVLPYFEPEKQYILTPDTSRYELTTTRLFGFNSLWGVLGPSYNEHRGGVNYCECYSLTDKGAYTSKDNWYRIYESKDDGIEFKDTTDFFEFTVSDAISTYKYGTDYDLYDRVTVHVYAMGMEKSARITEIQEVYDADGARNVISVGDVLDTETSLVSGG